MSEDCSEKQQTLFSTRTVYSVFMSLLSVNNTVNEHHHIHIPEIAPLVSYSRLKAGNAAGSSQPKVGRHLLFVRTALR